MALLTRLLVASACVAAGCYAPAVEPCDVRCGPSSPCPSDLVCGPDAHCHEPGDSDVCPLPALLYVTIDGAGAGRVTSAPAGVDCHSNSSGVGCEGIEFTTATMLQLTATPDGGGNTFAGWSGDACDGSTATVCSFMVTMNATVNARFD